MPPVRYVPPGDEETRRGRWTLLIVFWAAMVAVSLAAVLVAVVREPDAPTSVCPPPKECPGPPPVLPESRLRTWTSRERGVKLQYPVKVFAVDEQTDTSLRLRVVAARPSHVEASVWVSAQPGSDGLPQEVLQTRKDDLAASLLGLTEDDDDRTIIPAPSIGGVAGVGGSYRATADTPEGPAQPATAVLAAASNGRTTVIVSYVVTGTDDPVEITEMRAYLSPILTSFEWKR